MAGFRIDTQALKEYKSDLEFQKSQLIRNASDLRNRFANFQWRDNVYEVAKQSLNSHIATLNKLIFAIEQACRSIDRILAAAGDYLGSV